MNRYVISCDVLESIGNDTVSSDYYTDVLFVFAQENPYHIVIDNKNVLYNQYYEIGKKEGKCYWMIRLWFETIIKKLNEKKKIFDPTDPEIDSQDNDILCLSLAKKIPNHYLITSSKQHFENKYPDESKKIKLIEGDEAKRNLNPQTIIFDQKTDGEKSPITNNFYNK